MKYLQNYASMLLLVPVFILSGFSLQYSSDEIQPTYPGGMKALFTFFSENLKYPSEAKQSGIEGKVFLRFEISKTGAVQNIETIRGIGYGCDEEAVRIMKNSIDWNPGTVDGTPVRTSMVLPITFKIDGPEKEE